MLEHMTQPGALVLAHAAQKAAWRIVGAAVFSQAGQCGDERVDERAAQPCRGPGFQRAQVKFQSNDRKVRVQRGADIDRTIEDTHEYLP